LRKKEKKKQDKEQMEEIRVKTQVKMHRWLISLIICTWIIAVIDGVSLLCKEKYSSGDLVVLVMSQINSIIYAALTIGLLVSTFLVFRRVESQKRYSRPVIKDKCAMSTMTLSFTLAYLLKTLFLVIQGFWLGTIDPTCSFKEYIDYVIFLSGLIMFDMVPILVVLIYHFVTLKNSKDYVVLAKAKKSFNNTRLYSIDDLSDDGTDPNRASFNGTSRFSHSGSVDSSSAIQKRFSSFNKAFEKSLISPAGTENQSFSSALRS
jgi:hypothetical protein